MYEAAPQSVFTPISSSAEYIGSHVVFNAVPPTHELPLGCDVDATQQGEALLGHFLGYDSGTDGGNDLRFTSKSGLGSQAANQRAKIASESGGYSSSGASNYIRCFSLLHSHIGDTGLKMNPVTDAILQMATIESGPRFPISELNLGFCSLTEESASTVISLISALPHLQKVTLVGNMFGNVINVLDNDALLGDFNASLQVENELTTHNDPHDDDSTEDEMVEGASPLADFMALLSECWSNHPHLAQVIVDPWLYERFPTLEAIRKQRVPLLRKQAASSGRNKAALDGYAKALIDMHEGGPQNNSMVDSNMSFNRRASIRDDEAEDFSAFAPSQRFQDIMNNVLRNAASFLSKPQSSGCTTEDSRIDPAVDLRHVVSHLTLVELQAREALGLEEAEEFQSMQSQYRSFGLRKSIMGGTSNRSAQQWWDDGSFTRNQTDGGGGSQIGGDRRDAARSTAFRKRTNDFLTLESDMRHRHEKRESDSRKKIGNQMQAAMKAFFAEI
jgi:hypothetical protein